MAPSAQPDDELFDAARKLADPAAREHFLIVACGEDSALRRRVQELLAADAVAAEFFSAGEAALQESLAHVKFSEKAGVRIGRYKLLQELGEGGCGVVYMAEQEQPVRRRVALKIIKLGMDTRNVVARFNAEQQALALMDHPNIARVLDAGATETGRPFFVMELVRGIRITDYCDRHHLSARERLELFLQVCQAVQHAHQKGIIHRDLKPSNILVTTIDGVAVPKIIDFGIAKATQGRLTDLTLFTAFEQFLGTPAYMSPEQAVLAGVDVDTRSDIYSLGVLLYELLTGKTPFSTRELLASGLDELRRTIREVEPERPSTRLRGLPGQELSTTASNRHSDPPALIHSVRGDLDWIVMKCLEKNRSRRYQTAAALALDLERYLRNDVVSARPPDLLYQAGKAIQRRKLVFISALIITASLLASLVLVARQAREAKAARFREREHRLAAEANLYVANMHLIQNAWEQDDILRVRQLLAETAGYPKRSFEWNFWQRQAHSALFTFRGHRAPIASVAFSPDGQFILSGSEDRTARISSARDGRELSVLRGHSAAVTSVAFSPDGTLLLTGSRDQTIKLWDAAKGREIRTLSGHTAAVLGVAFSHDGTRIVTAGHDRTAKIWDIASGKLLRTIRGHAGPVLSANFSPDDRKIVTASWDRTARVWDALSGEELLLLQGHRNGIRSVTFSPDGTRIITGSDDHTAKVWNAATGREESTFKGHKYGVYAIAVARDGETVLSASWDETAKLWNLSTGQELSVLRGHSAPVLAAGFSADGKAVVTGSADQTVKVWNPEDLGGRTLHLPAAVLSLACSKDGRHLAAGCDDYVARIWSLPEFTPLVPLAGHKSPVWHVAFSPQPGLVFSSSGDPSWKLWSFSTGQLLQTRESADGNVWSVTPFPDGDRAVTSDDRRATVSRLSTGENLFSLTSHTRPISATAISPDGKRLVTASWDHTAKIWDADSGTELLTLRGHAGEVLAVAISADGKKVITGSEDRSAKVWDIAAGRELLTLNGHGAGVWSVAFSPDGQRILTAGDDLSLILWDALAGKELLRMKGHTARVTAASFSPNGAQIFSGSHGHTVKTWDTASEEEISRWNQEETAAAEIRAANQKQDAEEAEHERVSRSKDPGAIKDWLVLMPIPFGQRSGAEALLNEQLGQESSLQPFAGQQVNLAGRIFAWRAVRLSPDALLNFNELAGGIVVRSVAYAVARLKSDAAQENVLLKVGSDDEARIYLNRQLVYENLTPRICTLDQDAAAGLQLHKGTNTVVFKIVNETAGWQGSLRFTAADGQPLQGIEVLPP